MPKPASFWFYLLACYILLRACFLSSPWREGRAITYDPAGYYMALPAKFIYDDLATFSFYDSLATQYKISDAVSHTTTLPNGNRVMKYSLGMAILSSPGFFVGHQVAKASEVYPADGYSTPYYFYLMMWSLLWSFIGLWVLRKVLLHFFDDWTVAATLIILVLTTNYLNYAGTNNLMSHSFLFTLYAFLLYLSWKWHEKTNWSTAISIGVVIGLMALTRPTEIIAAIIPLLWGIGQTGDWSRQLAKFKTHALQLLLAAGIMLMIGTIQLMYWKAISGQWIFYSYTDQGFDFLHPKLYQGLFSFRKGWLIYTPIMLFAIIGLWPLFRKHKSVFWSILVFSIINIYIVYSWKIWTYGGSIGSRAMVQSYAVWCIPLAAFIQYILYERSFSWKIAFAILILFFTDLNLLMSWHARAPSGRWHAEYMTRAYYAKIAGRTVVPQSAKKFLDIATELPNTQIRSIDTLVLETFDAPQDSTINGRTRKYARSGSHAIRINANYPAFEPMAKVLPDRDYEKIWLRASVNTFYINMEWHEWRMARLQLIFLRNGQQIDERSIRLQWLSDPWVWQRNHFEVPLTEIYADQSVGDEVIIKLYNGGGDKDIFLDDLTLEWIQFE